MRKQLLGVVLAVLAPASLQGQSVNPADLAGDWSLAEIEQYGETNYQRMTVETTGDRITAVAWGLKLEGGIRDGRLELKRSGKDGPPVTMSGTVERDGMVGDLSIEDLKSRWLCGCRGWLPPPFNSRRGDHHDSNNEQSDHD